MRRAVSPVLALGLLALAAFGAAPVAAKGEFYESTIITDTAEDYRSNGALDIVAVHVGEKFSFDQEKRSGVDVIDFRFEMRAIAEMANLPSQTLRYDLRFKLDGAAKNATATAVWNAEKGKPDVTGGYATTDSVVIRLRSDTLGLIEGSQVTDSWATTGLGPPEAVVFQDQAPKDNTNLPSGPMPTADQTGSPYVASRGFPFLTIESRTPTAQYSVGGDEVRYEFSIALAGNVQDDKVLIFFQGPAAWDISPSQGTPSPDAKGEFVNVDGGQTIEFFFGVSSDGAIEGEIATILMEVVSLSGGHEFVQTVTTVSGPKVSLPQYTFALTTPGPFTAEKAATLAATVSDLAGPLTGVEVSADFVLGGTKRATVIGVEKAPGTFEFAYTFPEEGDWTVDVFVSDLKPSPHEDFVVHVKDKGGLAPGPGEGLLVLALLGALGLVRRRA